MGWVALIASVRRAVPLAVTVVVVVAAWLQARSRNVFVRNSTGNAIDIELAFGDVARDDVRLPGGALRVVALDGIVYGDSELVVRREGNVVHRCGYEDGLIANDYVLRVGVRADGEWEVFCEQLPTSATLMRLAQ